jgi:hypothetical protein
VRASSCALLSRRADEIRPTTPGPSIIGARGTGTFAVHRQYCVAKRWYQPRALIPPRTIPKQSLTPSTTTVPFLLKCPLPLRERDKQAGGRNGYLRPVRVDFPKFRCVPCTVRCELFYYIREPFPCETRSYFFASPYLDPVPLLEWPPSRQSRAASIRNNGTWDQGAIGARAPIVTVPCPQPICPSP